MNRFEVYAGVNDHPESLSEHLMQSFHDMSQAKQYAIQLFQSSPFRLFQPREDEMDSDSDSGQWVHVYDTHRDKVILRRYA